VPIKRALAAVADVLGVGTIGATVAKADPPARNTAEVLGTIDPAPDGTSATLRVRYTCQPQSPLPHIWVSAKETADGRRDQQLTQEGSSQLAAGWLQSHPDPAATITCDGKSHIQTFTIDEEEQGKGQLVKGEAWVQFCLTTGNGPDDPNFALLVNETRWVHVK
jgi:hypothetical protein